MFYHRMTYLFLFKPVLLKKAYRLNYALILNSLSCKIHYPGCHLRENMIHLLTNLKDMGYRMTDFSSCPHFLEIAHLQTPQVTVTGLSGSLIKSTVSLSDFCDLADGSKVFCFSFSFESPLSNWHTLSTKMFIPESGPWKLMLF